MNAGFDPNARVVVVAYWERNHEVGRQLQDNYRLIREERITARKVQLVFKPIVFQPWVRPTEEFDRYWEDRREVKPGAPEARQREKYHEWVAEAADCLTDED